MTEQEKQAIIDVLGRTDEYRFYVYALVDPRKNQTFYIGKGQGDRIWQHEHGADYEKNKILEDSNLSEEEKINQIENISKKHAVINSIKEESYDVQNAIIKWGLTEEEAFSAESALINLYKYQGVELTNIQNGHASEKEKTSILATTQALSVEDFLQKNCKLKSFKDLLIDLNDKNKRAIFINIVNSYNPNMKDDEVANCSRGSWVIDKNINKKLPAYLFAVNDSVVCGVYKVANVYKGFRKEDESLLRNRIVGKDVANDDLATYKNLCASTDTVPEFIDTYEKFKEEMNRTTFVLNLEAEDKYLKHLKEEYCGWVLSRDDQKSVFKQNPIMYSDNMYTKLIKKEEKKN